MPEATVSDWALEGTYAEACNCKTACPCIWLNPPTEGDCKLLVAWHIEHGHYHDLELQDLNVALACYAPGHMAHGGWRAALYLDTKAKPDQQHALTQIFAGKLGGHPAVLMSFVGEVLGVKPVPISFKAEERRRVVNIANIAAFDIEAIDGIHAGEVTIDNPPLCVVPSHPSVVAKSIESRYEDFDLSWEISDRNGYFSPFKYHA
jgi:hypothetical protein